MFELVVNIIDVIKNQKSKINNTKRSIISY